jgi:hypothetical protein
MRLSIMLASIMTSLSSTRKFLLLLRFTGKLTGGNKPKPV